MNKVEIDENKKILIFQCPHCDIFIEVEQSQINCSIFRHGYYYFKSGENIVLTQQVQPHESKEICDKLVQENKIYGCGKPFQLVQMPDGYYAKICGYI